MKNLSLKSAILATAVFAASAQAQEWKGVGEFGLAITGGNTDTTNINGKVGLIKESDAWKHEFGVGILRASAKQSVAGSNVTITSAKRYDAAWTSGYKLSDTSYIYGNLRYENDFFGAFRKQTVAGLGYGFYAIKEEPTTLLFEIGAGYRRAQPQYLSGLPSPDSEGDAILRGKIDFNHKITDNTAIFNTFLLEAGSSNKFYQNDLGLAVKMSDAFAIKTGLQIRYNSKPPIGLGKTDRLFTTNLVYSF